MARLVALAAMALAGAASFAQVSSAPNSSWLQEPSAPLNTRSFFPQIDDSPRARPVRPANPKFDELQTGLPNTLSYGGSVGGNASFGASGPKFPGAGFSGSIPPDPDIAVGPGHIVQVVNGSVSFYRKDGTRDFTQPDSNTGFWAGIGATSFIFDPKVFFDIHSGRFVIVELEQSDSPQISKLLIAVSDDSDPNGNWFRYRIEASQTVGGNNLWLDYPGWGYNTDGYVCTGNMFPFGAGSVGSQAITFRKAPMLTGQPTTVSTFTLNHFTVQSARTPDAGMNRVFGVARNNSTSLAIYSWSTLDGTPTMNQTTVAVPSYSGINANAPSTGGQVLDTIGDRMMSSFASSGRIWATHTIRTSDNRSQIAWYEFNLGSWPTTGGVALSQSGTIAMPGNEWALMPSIGRNNLGDVSVVFTRSSSSISADMMVATRRASDPTGTMGTPVLLAGSQGNQMTGNFRFGDYSDVEIDTNGSTFWGVANTFRANNRWGTDIVSWTVSTGGGGGGNGALAPDAVSTFFGAFQSGGVASVAATDNSFYEINSAMSGAAGQLAACEMRFTIAQTAAQVAKLDFNAAAIVTNSSNVTGSLFLFNNRTAKWDLLRTYTMPTTGTGAITLSTNKGTDYVNSNRQVRLMVRSLEAINRQRGNPPVHRLRVNSGSLLVTPKA